METPPIKTESDYRVALKEIETLMTSEAEYPMGDRLDVIVTLVQAYEQVHYPIDSPDPVEAIKFRMEQQGLTVDDLVPVIGRKNRVCEILAKKRPLTLRMIEELHDRFSIPAESLLRKHQDQLNGRIKIWPRIFLGVVAVFQHRCPNNSISILHTQRPQWEQLFPRHR